MGFFIEQNILNKNFNNVIESKIDKMKLINLQREKMKIKLMKSLIFLGVLVLILTGCDKHQFDRKKAINQYVWNVGNMNTPVSQNIKQQKTTMKRSNGDYINYQIEANKDGQVTSFITYHRVAIKLT